MKKEKWVIIVKVFEGCLKMKNNKLILKIALLSCPLVTASANAIAGNIPEIAKSFPEVPLSTIELMTTIPSLFVMLTILASPVVSAKTGRKTAIAAGAFLCGIGGVLPFFIQNIYLMLAARALFGIGSGLISANLLILILSFFEGEERSSMIGLQGSIGGLGSLLATFIAGRLLVFGWNVSFLTYLIGFAVCVFVLLFIPETENEDEEKKRTERKPEWGKIFFWSFLSFFSVNLATFFVIKGSSLITGYGYGTVQDGSTVIMCISAGSLLAGAMYGKIYAGLKEMSLVLFYVMSAVSFVIGGVSQNLMLTFAAAFVLGYGYLAFVPFLQEKAGVYGSSGTTVLLVMQSLGSFVTPYFGTFLNLFTEELKIQFLICAALYAVLTVTAVIIAHGTEIRQ